MHNIINKYLTFNAINNKENKMNRYKEDLLILLFLLIFIFIGNYAVSTTAEDDSTAILEG